jgi:uncharacterized protein (DUF427 family)
MKAVLGGTILAEADRNDLVRIEGNWYFPAESVRSEYLSTSATPYTCPWKGEAQYFTVTANGTALQDRAWTYPEIHATAVERVGRDFSNYVAFWKEVQVVE